MRTLDDNEIVRGCLKAAVEGPFFPDWEFRTLFGLEREEVASVLSAWPDTANEEKARLAANGAIENLLGYPHNASEETWNTYIPVSEQALSEFFLRWRRPAHGDTTAK